ncbi:MAG TPA: acyl-CoA dehydrogenase family protein [Acidimicrobiales bacterium]|nr:acyl-CoA dehydrogenase family protein [Acidimicrobiales bacterium]
MLVTLSEDQEFFRQTTERFLVEQAAPATLRALRDDTVGFDPSYWRRGAELGWTSLLVGAAHGGGSISDNGLVDLSLVAYEFGRHAAPGPLVATNVVAGTLDAHGSHPEVVEGLVSGGQFATWCAPEGSPDPRTWPLGVELRRDGETVVLDGAVQPVESAGQADHLLVTARDGGGVTQVLVPAGAEGLSVAPLHTVDLTKRFGAVRLDQVRLPAAAVVGPAGQARGDVERQFLQAIALLNAEAVGSMQAAFDMTVEWAFDRYTFGRPLASYQALKHRFADSMAWLEASHAISDAACRAVGEGSASAEELSSAAKAFVGQYGADIVHDCVQIHGGIGVTFEHDLHLFVRRFTVNRALAGTPGLHRQRVGAIVDDREGDAA